MNAKQRRRERRAYLRLMDSYGLSWKSLGAKERRERADQHVAGVIWQRKHLKERQ